MILKKDIKYIAQLCKLNFSEDEEKKIIHDLNKLINYIDKLNEINTENIDITVNPYYIENVYREDEIEESLSLEEVTENAPKFCDNYLVVPKVIE